MQHASLMILGQGGIARHLAGIAVAAAYPVSVCAPDLSAGDWPAGVSLIDKDYVQQPWPLRQCTHAVIARGHQGDADAVTALLEQGAAQVYLIASARRAGAVMRDALPRLTDPLALERLSAPAGLDLGGDGSEQIALSILAEIQWRGHGGTLLPLRELRPAKAAAANHQRDDSECPGKRS